MRTPSFRWIVALTILGFLFFYTAHRLQQIYPSSRNWSWAVTFFIFTLMIGWQFIYRTQALSIDSTLFLVLAWVGTMTLGFWAIFMIFSLTLDLTALALKIYKAFSVSSPTEPSRREFFTQWIPSTLGGISGGIGLLGLGQALAGPKIREVKVEVPGLPKELEGLKIAQISDLHVGPTIRKNYVDAVVRQVMELKPDLIAVTGDLIDGVVETLEPHARPLAELKAPLGVFYVTGNHEYYWGANAWIEKTKEWGFIPLMNENRLLQVGQAKLLVGGVTDTSAHQFEPSHQSDPHKAIQSNENADFKILLAHRPSSCFEAEKAGFGLQLSGHTHAGQFFPWGFFVALAHPYYKGLNRHEKMWVYVNAGTGYWGPAIRFAIPSEITLLRLTRKTEGSSSPIAHT